MIAGLEHARLTVPPHRCPRATGDPEAIGARPVLASFVEEVAKEGLTEKVTVTQTGCIGICQYEPVVEVFEDGKDKVTYVKMTADKAKRVVAEHLKGGKPVEEYVIGNK